MIGNPVKQRLAEGGVVLGTMVFEFASPVIARLAAAAGAEFVLFDQEHTGWSLDRVRGLLAAARGSGAVPFVRVPATEYPMVAGALDAGALGVMAPNVASVDQARRLVEFARFPPLGRRGFGLIYRDDWERGDAGATMERANRELLLFAQIETAGGLEAVEEIAAVDGIDVLWIGHFDLTASLGIPGRFDHTRYLEAVERVLAAGAAAGKAVGIMVGTPEEGRRALEQGFRILAYSGDLWLYQQALRDGLDVLRAHAASVAGPRAPL